MELKGNDSELCERDLGPTLKKAVFSVEINSSKLSDLWTRATKKQEKCIHDEV